MSQFAHKTIAEKKTLSLKDHQSLLTKLKKQVQIEWTFKSLTAHKLDDKLEETKEIVVQLERLVDHCRYGQIAHWILRQLLNTTRAEESKLQPLDTHIPAVIVSEPGKIRRSFEKSRSLYSEFSRKQIRRKIDKDPEAFDREMEAEMFREMLGDSCSFEL